MTWVYVLWWATGDPNSTTLGFFAGAPVDFLRFFLPMRPS